MNIRGIGMAGLVVAALGGCAQLGGRSGGEWVTLVDGTQASFANFERVGDANWRVAEGAIVADKGTGFLVTRNSYADFEIRAEFYAEGDTNSGIFTRCSDRVKITAGNCYEVNIWDKRPAPEYGTGAIVDVAKVSPMPKAGGKWNTYEVRMKGNQLTVKLNGVQTVDVKHDKYRSGPIGLQRAPGVNKAVDQPIKWRKVQIRTL